MGNQQPSTNTYIMNKKPKRDYGFIYCYTSPSGKKYIGQTRQTLIRRAKSINGSGYKGCSIFYRAIQKYGFENFLVEILEEAPVELIDEKEKEWIAFLDTIRPNGYNISTGGDGYGKKVYQYDNKTGLFLKEYSSLTEAARQNNIKNIQSISDCLHRRTKCAHGYVWRLFKAEKVDPQDYFSPDAKKVYAYTLDGKFYKEFESITEAARQTGSGRCDIKRVIKGDLKFSKEYIWSYEKFEEVKPVYTGENGRKPVAQINPETNKIIHIYGSQSDAARALNLLRPTGISRCCKGLQKTCAGFRWEFSEGSTTKCSETPVS